MKENVNGKITKTKSGAEGFGYDPIFTPEGIMKLLLLKCQNNEKGAISHRGRAVAKLVNYLTAN